MAEVGNISARATLDTASFRQGIKQMSQQMAIAREEFKQATSGLNAVDDELEIAQAKFKMLETQLKDQEKTVEQLNERYEAAKEQYGETSAKATEYRLALERSRTSLTNMRTDLNNVTNRIEELTNATEEGKSKFETFAENVEKSAEKMQPLIDAAKAAVIGLTALGAAAVAGMAVKGVMAADQLQKALNGLQAETGIADEKMNDMKSQMLEIYNNNFGETFEDIGKSMSFIASQTKKSGQELKIMTESGLALRDTFQIEIADSTKAVAILMENMGITSKEAYNLIAQGAQEGLNKNQDLTEMISEYSPHFASLGLNADEMFNMLANGAKKGVFDVEKLGDAVHELGIRAKDGSTTSADAFKSLGLDAEKSTAEFGKGGEAAGKMFKIVSQKLNDMKDPILKYNTGVGLFGTMWEEVQSKGMQALTETTGGINKSVDALKKINEVKYNTVSEFAVGLGRQLEVGIAIPIGQKVLPKLNELAQWAQSKMPEFQASVKSAMDISFVAFYKLSNVVKTLVSNFDLLLPAIIGVTAAIVSQMILSQVVTLYTAWKAATTTMTISQWALNAALTANPIGLVVAGIGLLVAAGVALYTQWDKLKKIFIDLPGPIQVLVGTFALMNPIVKPLLLIVGTIKGIQYAMSDSLKVSDIFGQSISKGTKEAVSGYMKLSDEAEKSLFKLQINSTVVSDNISKKLVTNFTNMADQIKQAMDKKFAETLAIMQGFYNKSDVLTSSEESKSLEKLKKLHDKEKIEVDNNQKFIEMILKNAADMRRALTEDESNKITELRKNMNKLAVENLSKTEIESKTILEKMRINASTITALQSADIIKNSIKTKEESIKNVEERYNREIGQIIKLRDESKTITADQATKLIKEAERQKNESIKKAEEMHNGIISEAKKQSKEHVNEVNWQTGEIKSKWSVFWADLKSDFGKQWAYMKVEFPKFWKEVGNSITHFGENTKKGWTKEWNALKEIISPAFTSMKNSFINFWKDVGNSIINFGSGLITKWTKEWEVVKSGVSSAISSLISSVKGSGGRIASSLWEGLNEKLDWVLSKITSAISKIKEKFSFSLPNIGDLNLPGFANGVNDFRGGLARINEQGGEIVNLPSGANVIPNDISRQIANAIGGSLNQSNNAIVNVYVTLDGKELTNTISKTQYDNQIINNRRLGIA